jgi:hypothetical protein
VNRERVERALPDWLRENLPELCRLYGVHDPDRWPHHRHLRQFLGTTAVICRRDEYMARGHSRTRSTWLAALDMGENPEAVRDRITRARTAYLKATERATDAPRNPWGFAAHHPRKAG